MLSSSKTLRHHSRLLCTAATTAAVTESTAAPIAKSTIHEITLSKAKSELRSEFDPDKTLKIYSSIATGNISPVATRYARDLTVHRLAKSKRFSDIETLIESHKKDPKITQEPYLCTLIRSYGLAGMFDHAMKLFDEMDELGTPRSAVSLNAILTACNQCRLYDKVPGLFEELSVKYGIRPNPISYGVLVNSYCELGKPELAIERLKEMGEKGIEVTSITYSTILHSLYLKERIDEAEEMWSEMVRKNVVHVGAYNVKLMQLQDGDPEKVKQLIEEMILVGLKPDTISYNYLMTSYFRSEMIEEAKEVYEDLKGFGLKPNAATFRTMVFHLCEFEQFEQGFNVFKKSVSHNKIPTFSISQQLVRGLVKVSRVKDAKGLIQTMKQKFPPKRVAWEKLEVELGLVSANSEETTSNIGQEDSSE